MRFFKLWRWLGCCLLLLPLLTRAADSVPVPALNSPVTDLTQTLTSEQIAALNAQLRAFTARKGSQFAILLVPSTQPETIEQYSIRVADAWKLGRKETDDGVLLLVAKSDRGVRIEVGYGLEGVLNDATSNRIIRQLIVPQFRDGNYYQGISDASTRIIQLIDGEVLPEPATSVQQSTQQGNRANKLPWPLLIFVVLAGGRALRGLFGRLGAAGVTAGGAGLLVWLFVGSLLAGVVVAVFALIFVLVSGGGGGWSNGPRGGWSSGSRGWGGGGGFGGGGFSGGGGGFGGGGASGRW